MSFGTKVKEEIASKLNLETEEEKRAFVSSIFRMIGSIEITRKSKVFRMEFASSDLLLYMNSIIEEMYGETLSFDFKGEDDEEDRTFVAKLDYNEKILIDTGMLVEKDGDVDFASGIGIELKSANEMRAYVLGCFLTAGGLYVPSEKKHSGYHLEIAFKEEEVASEVANMIAEISDIFMKKVERGEDYVLYVKEHNMICDMLGLLGATRCYFELLELVIERSALNNANRHGNCSAANAIKVADAGIKHVMAIQYLKDNNLYDSLNDKLKAAAEIRLANPNTPLEELAGMMNPPITKSGLNHRLAKIITIADTAKKENGDE